MHIAIVANNKFYNPGDIVPESMIMSDVPQGDLLLVAGEQNPEGEAVLIDAEAYSINRSIYDLNTVGYVLKTVVRDGELVPLLRKSKGQERYALTKLIKESQRHKTKRVGDMTLWWPITERTWEDANTSDEFIDEALNVLEEVGNEISEDFVFPQEPLEESL